MLENIPAYIKHVIFSVVFIIIFIYGLFQKFYYENQISPLFISGTIALTILGFGLFYLKDMIYTRVLEKEQEDKQSKKFWIVSAVLGLLIVFVFPLVYKILGGRILHEEYVSHIWLCSIILFYTAFFHSRLNSTVSVIVNICITIFFSLCVFIYVYFSGASTLDFFKHIYKLFDHLLLSKQLSFFNIVTWFIYTIFAYLFYTKQRYSGKGDSETCVWNTTDNDIPKKLFIAVLYFVFVIYPFILSWRTYSLENTDLVNSRYPLLFFSIFMFLLFLNLFLTGIKQEKQENNTEKQDNCNQVGRIDYYGSVAFNYIIWMCVGLLCNSMQITYSKNIAVKSRSLASPTQSMWFFIYNLGITLFHSFGTIFGGATLWKTM